MTQWEQSALSGRLTARPGHPATTQAPTGLQPLGLNGSRDGFLWVPTDYQPAHPLPLVLMLHGAGGNARGSLNYFLPAMEQAKVLLLVPDSRLRTWDLIEEGSYGPDAAFLDRALAQTFSRYAVDQAYLAISGFSDGASYALSLGLMNGDLFTHVLAFSPGFMVSGKAHGQPHIFIAHGVHDTVLPINQCSRRIVPRLQQKHYDVQYHEFDGPHTVPIHLIREAWNWFMNVPLHTE
jgi:phospholipase/carboxylesterase